MEDNEGDVSGALRETRVRLDGGDYDLDLIYPGSKRVEQSEAASHAYFVCHDPDAIASSSVVASYECTDTALKSLTPVEAIAIAYNRLVAAINNQTASQDSLDSAKRHTEECRKAFEEAEAALKAHWQTTGANQDENRNGD
ncbi:MAG: hypothetical protein AAFQ67_00715 [Pseudomonadota bacterium]